MQANSKQLKLTANDASRAATASMSAQDTTPGQTFSTSDFALSMISNPLTELTLGSALFSLSIVGLSSNKIDASQPCQLSKFFPLATVVSINSN